MWVRHSLSVYELCFFHFVLVIILICVFYLHAAVYKAALADAQASNCGELFAGLEEEANNKHPSPPSDASDRLELFRKMSVAVGYMAHKGAYVRNQQLQELTQRDRDTLRHNHDIMAAVMRAPELLQLASELGSDIVRLPGVFDPDPGAADALLKLPKASLALLKEEIEKYISIVTASDAHDISP